MPDVPASARTWHLPQLLLELRLAVGQVGLARRGDAASAAPGEPCGHEEHGDQDGGPKHGGDISKRPRGSHEQRRQRSAPRERLGGALGAEGERPVDRPARREPVEHAGDERVARAVGVDDRAGNRRRGVARAAVGPVGDDHVVRALGEPVEVEPLAAITAASDERVDPHAALDQRVEPAGGHDEHARLPAEAHRLRVVAR